MNNIIKLNDDTKNINKFWEQDILDFSKYPNKEISEYYKKRKLNTVNLKNIESETKREEYRDYLKSIFLKEFPFSYASTRMPQVFRLQNFFNKASFESIFDSTEKHEKEILDYFSNLGFTSENKYINGTMIQEQMKIAVAEFRDVRKGLDRDIWKISELKISSERINKSTSLNNFNFYNIKNTHNRELVKMWYKYLLGNTEFAISYLIKSLLIITGFCNFLGEIRIEDTDRILVLKYLDTLRNLKVCTYNKITNCISNFYKYLAIKEIYKNETPVLRTDFKQREQKHNFNSVSEYVILQIFRHLYELPFDLKLMYLINYSTGLRVSDLCQLETDCLLKSEKCYFIRFHIQKMQKDHAVPISVALGELIEKRVQELSKLEYKEKYLFPSKKNEPFKTRKYRDDMKKWCKKWHIKNEDSTPYNFLPHSYRHTIASNLAQEYDVDLEIIQLVVLGHANPSMSLCYIDETDEYKKMLNDKYVDKSGISAALESKGLIHPGWIKENLSKQVLSNGICSYPTVLGVCPNSDVCLDCEYFRTSKKYLPIHEKHLEELEKQILIYESNGWVNNLDTAREQKKQLEEIIKALT